MSAKLHTLSIQKGEAGPQQIETHLRRLIEIGEFCPGDRLPSVRQMARLWNTHVATVHAALERLANQKLVATLPGKGAFVSRPEERLTCAGTYFSENVWEHDWAGYQRAFYFAVKELLAERGTQMRLFVDRRPFTEQGTRFEPLLKAVGRQEIQALVSAGCTPLHLPWFQSLGLPLAFPTSLNVPFRVELDEHQMVQLSLRYLKEQGCRSVGVIVPTDPQLLAAPIHVHSAFFEELVKVTGDLGLEIRNEWVQFPREPECSNARQESFGYERFHQLWKLAERPHGLLVYPDSVVRGVLMAMLELSVRVPQQLKVVFHRNEEVNLFCPLAAAWVTSSVRATARAVMQQIDRQLRREKCDPIILGFTMQPPM